MHSDYSRLCIATKSFENADKSSGTGTAMESFNDSSLLFFSFHTLELNSVISFVNCVKSSRDGDSDSTSFSLWMLFSEYKTFQRCSVINGVIGANNF